MGEALQSGHPTSAMGHHPDADQLSAFLEQALPAHERDDVLTHLAICPDCRETVAMSMSATEVQEQGMAAESERLAALAQPEVIAAAAPAGPKRLRWFGGWAVLVPAGAALAALALFVAYLNFGPGSRQKEQATIAIPQPPATRQAPKEAPASAGVPVPGQTPQNGRDELAMREKSLAIPQRSANGNIGQGLTQSQFTSQGRLTQIAQAPAFQASQDSEEQKKSGMGFVGGLGGGSSSALEKPIPQPAPAVANAPPQSASAPAAMNSAAVPAPPAAAPAPPSATEEAVTVQSATPPQTSSIPAEEISSMSIDGRSLSSLEMHGALQRKLPSHQNVLSFASYGAKTLAIDARHTVFLSEDSGKHWKPVPAVWTGQAVEANLVLPSTDMDRLAPTAGTINKSFAAIAGRSQAFALNGNLSLTGTVKDMTGAVISGATVVVTDAAIKSTRTLKTDANGHYVASGLAAGSYELEVRSPGFQTLQLAGLAVDPSRPNVADLTLQIGQASETVMVESSAPRPETISPEMKTGIAAPAPAAQPPPLFEITTDNGTHWTSADGLTWKQN